MKIYILYDKILCENFKYKILLQTSSYNQQYA